MNEKYNQRLPQEILDQVFDLFDEGGNYQMGHKNVKAAKTFEKAYELLPEPKDQWTVTTSILANIAENYYLKARFDSKEEQDRQKYFQLSLDVQEELMKNPKYLNYPSQYMRIGEIEYLLGNIELSKEALIRAYMLGGREIFRDFDAIYYDLIRKDVEK